MKVKSQKSKVKIIVLLFISLLGQAAFGAAVTITGSAELALGSFSGTLLSGDNVVLGVTPEAQWTAGGLRVNTVATNSQESLSVDTDGSGGLFLAWEDYRSGTDFGIYAARVDTGGTVNEVLIANVINIKEDQPAIACSYNVGAPDGAVIAYRQAAAALYGAKVNLSMGKPWGSNKLIYSSGGTDRNFPKVVSDNAQGAVVAWQDSRTTSEEIYAQRLWGATGTLEWTASGVTVCANNAGGLRTNAREPKIIAAGSDAYMVAWKDERDNYNDFYVHKIYSNGNLDGDFGQNGKQISTSGQRKSSLSMVGMKDYAGAIFGWTELDGSDQDHGAYVQLMPSGGERFWGDTGLALMDRGSKESNVKIAALPQAGAFAAWVTTLGGYNGYAQKLTGYGTKELGADGIYTPNNFAFGLTDDGVGGVFSLSLTEFVSVANYRIAAQRLGANGQELWGNGLKLCDHQIVDTPFIVPSTIPNEVIYAWVDARSGSTDIYAQKIKELYQASGYYTSQKIENTDSNFSGWTTLDWSSSSLAGEVRTAATSAGLDSAAWESITNGGAVASNGRWLQARFRLDAGSGRTTTPALTSFSANFGTTSDVTSPEVRTTYGGVTLLSGDYIPERPLFNMVVTDDVRVASTGILFDSNPLTITYVSTADARWDLTCQPTVTIGDHTLRVEATDGAGNTRVVEYALTRSASPGVAKGGVKAMAAGNQVTIAYTMVSAARVKIEVRELVSGRKVRELVVDAGAAGGAAGYNEFSFDASNLPIGPYSIYVTPVGGETTTGTFSLVR